ncbi:hypothetical protein C8E89_13430 [Mycolicibacterium moriokaense]|uniref:Uncharacterized protein n=1 Tax=Mycolicibacterium moriokaense TaxID=39691 RepID=A0A318H6X4_9MYCO|nr:hypothetical protein C8E89_13430 [Mycolicibacterium moriokaense]
MEHFTKTSAARRVSGCDQPLTGKAVVNRIVSDLEVFDAVGDCFHAVELAPGVQFSDVVVETGASIVGRRELRSGARSFAHVLCDMA